LYSILHAVERRHKVTLTVHELRSLIHALYQLEIFEL
jgi:hypothetical protein